MPISLLLLVYKLCLPANDPLFDVPASVIRAQVAICLINNYYRNFRLHTNPLFFVPASVVHGQVADWWPAAVENVEESEEFSSSTSTKKDSFTLPSANYTELPIDVQSLYLNPPGARPSQCAPFMITPPEKSLDARIILTPMITRSCNLFFWTTDQNLGMECVWM